jgi:hypothetical protein
LWRPTSSRRATTPRAGVQNAAACNNDGIYRGTDVRCRPSSRPAGATMSLRIFVPRDAGAVVYGGSASRDPETAA